MQEIENAPNGEMLLDENVPGAPVPEAPPLPEADEPYSRWYQRIVNTNLEAKRMQDLGGVLYGMAVWLLYPCRIISLCVALLCVPVYLIGLIWCSTLPMYHLRYSYKDHPSVHQDATLLISSSCSSLHDAIALDAVCQFYGLCDIAANASSSSTNGAGPASMDYEITYNDNDNNNYYYDDNDYDDDDDDDYYDDNDNDNDSDDDDDDDVYALSMLQALSNISNDSSLTTTTTTTTTTAQNISYQHLSISRVNTELEVFVKVQWFISAMLSGKLYLSVVNTEDWKRFFLLLMIQNLASWNFRGIGTLKQNIGGCSVVYTPYYNSLFVSFLYSSMIAVAVWVLLVIIFLQRTERRNDLKLRKELGRLSEWAFANKCANVTVFLALIYAVVVPTVVLIGINLQQVSTQPSSTQNTSLKWLPMDIFLTQVTAYFVPDLKFSSPWVYTVLLQNLFFGVLAIVATLKLLENCAKLRRGNAERRPLLLGEA